MKLITASFQLSLRLLRPGSTIWKVISMQFLCLQTTTISTDSWIYNISVLDKFSRLKNPLVTTFVLNINKTRPMGLQTAYHDSLSKVIKKKPPSKLKISRFCIGYNLFQLIFLACLSILLLFLTKSLFMALLFCPNHYSFKMLFEAKQQTKVPKIPASEP